MESGAYLPVWSHQHFFVHIISGKKSWSSQKKEYEAQVGTTLFIEKGGKMAKQFFDEEMCMLMFFVTDDLIKEVIRDLPAKKKSKDHELKLDTVVEVNNTNALLAYFSSVLPFFMQDPAPDKTLLKLKFKELLLHIFTDPANDALAQQLCGLCASSKPSIKRVMEENFLFDMKIEDYARITGRSLSGFKREFQELYGVTPGKWLISRRLETAKELLGSADRQVNEVAWDSGFEDASHFTRVFKNTYGQTPSEYRVSCLAGKQ